MAIKAVIFDLDGVLIDAREWHYAALNEALALFGYGIGRYEHLTAYNGLPTRKKLEMLSTEKGLPHGLHDFLNEIKQQYTRRRINDFCRPSFAHEYALSRLRADGYRLAVCSNSIRDTLDMMLDRAWLSGYFDLTMSWEECGAPKPDPDIYLDAMARLDVLPEDTVIVEDSEHGVTAGRASGAHVMVVGDPSQVSHDSLTGFIAAIEAAKSRPARPVMETSP